MDFQRVRSDALQSNTNSAPSHRSNQQMKHALCVFVKGLFTDLSVAPFIILCTGANTPFAQIWFEQWTQTPNHSHIVVNCALFLFSFNTLSIFGQRFREIASLDHWQHTHTQSKFRAAMSYGLCYIWWSQYYKVLIFKLWHVYTNLLSKTTKIGWNRMWKSDRKCQSTNHFRTSCLYDFISIIIFDVVRSTIIRIFGRECL